MEGAVRQGSTPWPSTMDPLKKDDLLLSQKYGIFEDPDFSPARNKAVIDGTIKKMDKMQKKKLTEYTDQIRERSHAVASFFKHVNQGKHNNVFNYFGKRELARLRGEDIANQLKAHVITGQNASA